jgi:ATP-dependent RNA helicase RhlE
LAIQVDEALHPFCRAVGMRTAVLIGGESVSIQRHALEKNPRIIIATPGRLLDLLEHRTVTLSETEILVLDEADRMLDMGFAPQINKILAMVPKKRQTMLFSAMPQEIVAIAQSTWKFRSRSIAPATVESDSGVFFIGGMQDPIARVILHQYPGPVLVFTRTKHGARRLARQVRLSGHAAAEIHSDRSLAQRRGALEGFKTGKFRVLVATDIAARGIDVTGIEIVINYDLPANSEDYVHRIGRTARAGRAGRAISFATLDQRGEVKNIEQLIRGALTVKAVPTLPPGRQLPQTNTPARSVPPPQHVPKPQIRPPGSRAGRIRRPGGRRRARRLTEPARQNRATLTYKTL